MTRSSRPDQGSPGSDRAGSATATATVLSQAVARIRNALLVVTGVLVAGDLGWVLLTDTRSPLASFLVAAVATAALLASIWLVLGRMVRSDTSLMLVWVALGYLLRLVILGVALIGGRVLGLETRMIGVSLILAILAGMACETVVLSRTRVLTVDPGQGRGA